jgi:hypothetical protein
MKSISQGSSERSRGVGFRAFENLIGLGSRFRALERAVRMFKKVEESFQRMAEWLIHSPLL